jgi:hypothetical protein
MSWLILILALIFSSALPTWGSDRQAIEAEVQQVDSMRQTLVLGVNGQVNGNTFKAVCAPVGKHMKALAKKGGYIAKQATHKARNPKHQADSLEMKAIKRFQNEKGITKYWLDDQGESHFFQRIVVQEKCLLCHGSKEQRPDFIKNKYTQDQAFGFNLGDIRGVYHVRLKQEGKK